MSVVFVLTPVAILLALVGLGAFIWAAKRGQYDDTWSPAVRMLHDEPDPGPKEARTAERGDS